jgi:hypothetical protein
MVLLKPVKADTLIEAVTATLIVALVLTLALSSIADIEKMSNNRVKMKAFLITEKYIQETVSAKRFFDEVYEYEGITVTKSVLPFEKNKNLRVVEFQTRKEKHLLFERNLLIKP